MTTGRRSLAATTRKGTCGVCGKQIGLLQLTGMLYRHPKAAKKACPGSYTTPVREKDGAS